MSEPLTDAQVAATIMQGSLGGEGEEDEKQVWTHAPAPRAPRKVKKATKRAVNVYLLLQEGTLETGEKFWYIAHEESGVSGDMALRSLWMRLGQPTEGLTFTPVLKDKFHSRTVVVTTVVREPIKKVVVV